VLSEKETTRLSKFLSLVLRHQPQEIDLVLDESGWATVTELLEKLKTKGFALDRAALEYVVATNNKKRFAFNEDGTMIRASQGHSVEVELGYAPQTPPTVLYHGTAEKNVAAILKEGLQRRSRRHVHLSTDKATAIKVGQRHGKPVVLEVMSGEMHKSSHTFYLSANGVWLTDSVPPQYVQPLPKA
jgi:putative RNA 2'-phosphotransferase